MVGLPPSMPMLPGLNITNVSGVVSFKTVVAGPPSYLPCSPEGSAEDPGDVKFPAKILSLSVTRSLFNLQSNHIRDQNKRFSPNSFVFHNLIRCDIL